MINFIAWIIFGALAGWIASLIMGTNERQGALGNIVIGILGAFIGGFIIRSVTGNDVDGFNLLSLLVAVFGAVLLIGLVKLIKK